MIPNSIQTSEGLKLAVYHWEVAQPKAVILLIHGLGEHLGRYEHVSAAFNAAGYAVVGLDHRSHGKSEGEPRCFVRHFDVFIQDLGILWEQIKSHYAELPRFVLGHSMGGHIAVRFTHQHQSEMVGLITSGVGIVPGKSIPALAIQVVKWLGKIAPMLPTTALDVNYLSRDPKVIQDNLADPLVYHEKLRAGMGYSMFSMLDDTVSRLSQLTLPLLVLHGEADKIADVTASQRLYEMAQAQDKTLKIYPELYHEILNEPEQQVVLTDISTWLDAH